MTDYYSVAEDGLISLLKTDLASYFPNGSKQVTDSDDTILDNGNNNYVITYPGSFPIDVRTSSFVVYDFVMRTDILVRWTDKTVTAWSAFKDLRNAILVLINHTERGRTLGKTNWVKYAFIQSESEPRYIPVRGTDPDNPVMSHIGQICQVTVKMQVPW